MLAASANNSLEKVFSEIPAVVLEMLLMICGIALLVALVSYVLHSIGLYSIAKRRGVPRPWLAWLPIGGSWILGSISDRYQFVHNQRFRNRKKLLACMELTTYILAGVIFFSFINLLFNTLTVQTTNKIFTGQYIFDGSKYTPQYKYQSIIMQPRQDVILAAAQLVEILVLALDLVTLLFYIFRCIAYYDLFASCRPKNAAIFLVVGILFSVTMPFFVFACRKHDLGLQGQTPQSEAPGLWDAKAFTTDP